MYLHSVYTHLLNVIELTIRKNFGIFSATRYLSINNYCEFYSIKTAVIANEKVAVVTPPRALCTNFWPFCQSFPYLISPN